jgi:hypothetical protein
MEKELHGFEGQNELAIVHDHFFADRIKRKVL